MRARSRPESYVRTTLVFRDLVDDNGLTALADFMTDRRLDLQFATRLQAEINLIEHTASDPASLGYAGDRSETHPGCAAHDIKDGWNSLDFANAFDTGLEIMCHGHARIHASF